MTHVVVVGGGITGLAAAYELRRGGGDDRPEVTLLEASDRLGGKILTTPFDGRPIDAGPDAFLVRVPWALDLCRELGLADELVAPSGGSAYVWWDGTLHRLPDGLVLGVPSGLGGLARSGLLSWRGKARAAVEPLLPRRTEAGDNLATTVRTRFGTEVYDRLVGPLVGSINAADPERMSLAATAPQLAAVADQSRSLLLGLRRAAPPRADAPVFLTHPAGLGHVVDRLAGAVRADGATIRLDTPVHELARTHGGWSVDGLPADAVVLAAPAPAAAGLMSSVDAETARRLGAIRYSSVVLVTLAVRAEAFAGPLDGSGYLVPVAAQRHVTACSWASSKWPHWGHDGEVVLRASLGRDGDEHAMDLDDDAIVDATLADLTRHVGLRGEPTAVRVARWPSSFPQYEPGHLDRVGAIEAALPNGIVVAGAAMRGIGIPACIRQGREAARQAMQAVAQRARMAG